MLIRHPLPVCFSYYFFSLVHLSSPPPLLTFPIDFPRSDNLLSPLCKYSSVSISLSVCSSLTTSFHHPSTIFHSSGHSGGLQRTVVADNFDSHMNDLSKYLRTIDSSNKLNVIPTNDSKQKYQPIFSMSK